MYFYLNKPKLSYKSRIQEDIEDFKNLLKYKEIKKKKP